MLKVLDPLGPEAVIESRQGLELIGFRVEGLGFRGLGV